MPVTHQRKQNSGTGQLVVSTLKRRDKAWGDELFGKELALTHRYKDLSLAHQNLNKKAGHDNSCDPFTGEVARDWNQ